MCATIPTPFTLQEGYVYAMAKAPLPSSLLKHKSKTAQSEAVPLFKLVSPAHVTMYAYFLGTCIHRVSYREGGGGSPGIPPPQNFRIVL